MKIERTKPQDAQSERYIVTAMIMSGRCCKAFKDMDCKEYLQTSFAKTIADWCLQYYDRYETAPAYQIKAIFEEESDFLEQDIADMTEKFLESLSEEFERTEHFNSQYWIDYGEKYFKARSYKKLAKEIARAADQNDVKRADELYSDFNRVEVAQLDGVNVFDQKEITELQIRSEESDTRKLFKMPGALGEMIGWVERETFFAFLAREKAGKSYVLEEFGFRAYREGCKVAYFDMGDMSKDQSDYRYLSYVTGKPYNDRYAGPTWIPILDCLWNQDGRCTDGCSADIVKQDDKGKRYFACGPWDEEGEDHETCIECKKEKPRKFRGSVWWKKVNLSVWAWTEARRRAKWFETKFRRGVFERCNWPMGTRRISDVESWIVQNRERNGWVPDVVIVDYPDIALPEDARMEFRHRENEKWMRLRSISQKFHCSVITVTQSDAAGYKKKNLDLSNFNEDKRKYGHVTHFYAINKTLEEQELGLMRIAALILREDEMSTVNNVTVLQALRKGRPYTASFFGSTPKLPVVQDKVQVYI